MSDFGCNVVIATTNQNNPGKTMNSQYIKQHEKEYTADHCTLYSEIDFNRYLAGAMSPDEQELFEQHCGDYTNEVQCEDCASALDNLKRTQWLEQEIAHDEQAVTRIAERTKKLLRDLILP